MSTLELDLGEGASVFVDVPDAAGERRQDVANRGERLQADFAKVSASLAGIVRSVEAQLEALPRRPDEVQIEMGAELRGEADLWLVSGEAAGHMKVTLAWKGPAR